MPRRLRYEDQAISDLDAIRCWQIQPGSGPTAIQRVKIIRAAIQKLKRDPWLYPVGDHSGILELPCEGHRVMYEVQPDTGGSAGDVFVLRVFGPGQSRDRL